MASTDWVVYTRSDPYCVWCERLKVFLKARNIRYEERDIYTIYDREVFVPGAPVTVPQVYYKGMLIGGYDRTKDYILK